MLSQSGLTSLPLASVPVCNEVKSNDIKPWYVKASEKHEKLDKVPVIVKVPTPTKDGESMRLVVQRINVLRDQDKPLYNELNSLSDPRFEKFVEACNGVLTVENLNKVFGRKSVSKIS